MKTMKKTLAVVLAMCMLLSMGGMAALAFDLGTPLPTEDSDDLEFGAWWFDLEFYISNFNVGEAEANVLRTQASFYLSGDRQTFTIVTDEGAQSFTREQSPEYFSCLRQHYRYDPAVDDLIPLPVNTNKLQPGDLWFNSAKFAALKGDIDYKYYSYYLSTDGNTMKYTDTNHAGPNPIVVINRETAPEAFTCVMTLAPFGDPLPDSPEGLADGAFWFDRAALLEDLAVFFDFIGEDADLTEQNLAAVRTAPVRLSADNTVLRMTLGENVETQVFSGNEDGRADEPGVIWDYLHQAGVGDDALRTLLPTSDSAALEAGDYWFDLEGWLAYYAGTFRPEADYYRLTKFSLSDDGNTLRYHEFADEIRETTRENDTNNFFAFLRRHGEAAPDLTGFTPVVSDKAQVHAGDLYFDLEQFLTQDDVMPEDMNEAAAAVAAGVFRQNYGFFRNEATGALIARFGSSYISAAEDRDEMLPFFNAFIYPVFAANDIAPSCITPGYSGDLSIERDGEVIVIAGGTVLDATGHYYGAPVWRWADDFTAAVEFSCERCYDTATPAVTVTAEVVAEPTAEADGLKVYTASVTFEGNTYTSAKEEVLPATGAPETPAGNGSLVDTLRGILNSIRSFFARILDAIRGLFSR